MVPSTQIKNVCTIKLNVSVINLSYYEMKSIIINSL